MLLQEDSLGHYLAPLRLQVLPASAGRRSLLGNSAIDSLVSRQVHVFYLLNTGAGVLEISLTICGSSGA